MNEEIRFYHAEESISNPGYLINTTITKQMQILIPQKFTVNYIYDFQYNFRLIITNQLIFLSFPKSFLVVPLNQKFVELIFQRNNCFASQIILWFSILLVIRKRFCHNLCIKITISDFFGRAIILILAVFGLKITTNPIFK